LEEENRKRISYIAKHYDSPEEAEWYRRATPASSIKQWIQDRELSIVTSYLDPSDFPGSRPKVLDIGCSSGRYTTALLNKGFDVVGIDTAAIPLSYAVKWAPEASFIRASALDLPFEREGFDVVICIGLLHHFNDEVVQKALMQIAEVTKPKGSFVFNLRNKRNPVLWYLYRKLDSIEFTVKTRTVSQMARIMEGCGFTIIRKKSLLLPITSVDPFPVLMAEKSI